ncbi:MAG TPA: tetratricopeptide repeat protein, partial [Chromatiales bacterium]|nr:tetratricopeptide repeat protein [Chromatiales bacterium]
MNLIALGVGITLLGSLWPFGGHDAPEHSDATIADLKPRELRLKMQPGVEDGGASARAQYRTFIEVPDAPAGLKAEAMRRLADLSVRAGEMANADGESDASFYQDAIGLYEQLLAANPDYPDRDLILYQLARAHEITGDSEAALAVLDQLVQLYPDSRFVDEAQFRRGE